MKLGLSLLPTKLLCLSTSESDFLISDMSIVVPPPSREEIAIIQLKDRIYDIMEKKEYVNFTDDLYLMRWLKAEHLNAEKTEVLIRRALKWRKETFAYTLLKEEVPEDYAWNYPFYSDGVDKDGIPVYSLSAGSWDLRRMVESGEKDKFVRYVTQMYLKIEEHMIQLNRERHAIAEQESSSNNCEDEEGSRVPKSFTTGVIVIVDLKGYTRTQLTSLRTVEAALEIATNYGNYFPQVAERVYLINVSRVFAILFKMLKPLLNLSCVEVFDTNEKNWKPVILSRIDPDQIRPEFGGTKIDPCSIIITPCEDYIPTDE